jgi:uncharacterized membrane protein YidH (DUF202 family)
MKNVLNLLIAIISGTAALAGLAINKKVKEEYEKEGKKYRNNLLYYVLITLLFGIYIMSMFPYIWK